MNTDPAPGVTPSPVVDRTWTRSRIGFVVFMAVLTLIFVALGTWQVFRLQEKDALTARIAERIGNAPIALPPVAEWVGFDPQTYDYRPVTLTGSFDYSDTVLVFTSLFDQKGRYGGPGYWVMTPMDLTGGGTIFVNRGFVPQDLSRQFVTGGTGPEGETEITGIGRAGFEPNLFTPGPDLSGRIDWIRNIGRLSAFMADPPEHLAPIYVDQAAGESGALPQGGETTLNIPNRHFGYILTWYGLAILTPLLVLTWWRRGTGA